MPLDAHPLGPTTLDLLARFEQYRVRYLIVGRFALALYGPARFTPMRDPHSQIAEDSLPIELWIERSPDNAARAAVAIEAFEGAQYGHFGSHPIDDIDDTPFTAEEMLAPWSIHLPAGPDRVEILKTVSGLTFEAVYPARTTLTLDAVEIDVIDRASLVAYKRATGIAQDLDDVEILEGA